MSPDWTKRAEARPHQINKQQKMAKKQLSEEQLTYLSDLYQWSARQRKFAAWVNDMVAVDRGREMASYICRMVDLANDEGWKDLSRELRHASWQYVQAAREWGVRIDARLIRVANFYFIRVL